MSDIIDQGLREEIRELQIRCHEKDKEIAKLEAEKKDLLEALKQIQLGCTHRSDCFSLEPNEGMCNCGLWDNQELQEEAIAKAGEPESQAEGEGIGGTK